MEKIKNIGIDKKVKNLQTINNSMKKPWESTIYIQEQKQDGIKMSLHYKNSQSLKTDRTK